jgi:nucleotide-binding universal stress UspA family protein
VTIVLGYDESPGSQRALEVAIDLAVTYREPLVLVYGVTPPGTVGEEFRSHMAAVEELGRKATQHALERAAAAGAAAEVALVHEKPAAALVDVADQRDARMIVVGSYGETPLRGVILGSTTYKVLNESHRPVLVVKA